MTTPNAAEANKELVLAGANSVEQASVSANVVRVDVEDSRQPIL
jgi:hypothetical protein